jgi:hypothetical protein
MVSGLVFSCPPFDRDHPVRPLIVAIQMPAQGNDEMRSIESCGIAERDDHCIRVIVSKDFLEVRARFRHGLGTGLAETDAVSPADSPEDGLLAFFSHDEVIARDHAPA